MNRDDAIDRVRAAITEVAAFDAEEGLYMIDDSDMDRAAIAALDAAQFEPRWRPSMGRPLVTIAAARPGPHSASGRPAWYVLNLTCGHTVERVKLPQRVRCDYCTQGGIGWP